VRREDFNYPSADRRTEIHAVRWLPDGEVKAVLQIAHGMAEYMDRYEPFAAYLTEQGFLVTGNDHLGHGKSIADESCLGYFPPGGNKILIKDMHDLRVMTSKKYPGVPYFLMGHSMGSFLARQYLCLHGEGLSGAIIMGTGSKSRKSLKFAMTLAGIRRGPKGRMHRSKMLNRMAFSGYTKRIPNAPTKMEWLTRDEDIVLKYVSDPLCGFPFTNSAFREMFRGMLFIADPDNLKSMPADLPVLFVSGAEDPVGAYGRDVRKVADQFRTAGMQDVTSILYPDDRHEVLNEKNRKTVFTDLFSWMTDHMCAAKE